MAFSEVGEINVRHGELQVPFLNGDPEGLADDLVTKADTEYFQTWFLGDDVLGVCNQLLDPREVIVDGRTGAANQDTVVMDAIRWVGGHVIDDIVAVKGEGHV